MTESSPYICYTSDGRRLDPWFLEPDDIRLEDIAIRLARLHRWAAAIPYTVAEHSIACAVAAHAAGANPEHVRLALLHDAAEAWLGDVPAPLRVGLAWAGGRGRSFDQLEGDILRVIHRRFAAVLPTAIPGAVSLQVWDIDQSIRLSEERYWFKPETIEERTRLALILDPYGIRTGPEAAARAEMFATIDQPDPGPGDRRIADLFLAHALSLGIQ